MSIGYVYLHVLPILISLISAPILIQENLQIMSITDSSLDCVTVVLQWPTNTTGIMSYTVVATLGNMDVSEGTSDDGDDLTVEVCGLSLCSDSYMFQARANGGGICPSELMSFTPTLSSMDQVANVRLGDGGTLEWDAPSNVLSAGCIIQSYTIRVSGSTITTATNATSELLDSQFDTCDSRLNITIGANVVSIGLVGNSISDSFTPSSVFLSPGEVTISGTQVMYTSSYIRVPLIASTTDQRFPEAEFLIEYSGTQPGCVGSSQAQDVVASVVYSCLDDSDVTFNATYEDPPDCRSNTIPVPTPPSPLLPSIGLEPTVKPTSDGAEISYPSSAMVAANNFNTVGIVFQSDGNTVVTSDTTTYPENVVFRDLVFNTSYRYTLQVVSKDDNNIIIGSVSGTFDTTSSGLSPGSIAVGAVLGGVVGGVVVLVGVVIVVVYRFQKKKGSKSYKMDCSNSGKGKKRQKGQKHEKDTELEAYDTVQRPTMGPSPPLIPTGGDYSQLLVEKDEEAAGGEEYNQLRFKDAPRGVFNPSDPNYSHFEGGQQGPPQGQQRPPQGRQQQSPPLPNTVADQRLSMPLLLSVSRVASFVDPTLVQYYLESKRISFVAADN